MSIEDQNYSNAVRALKKPGSDIKRALTAERCDMLHMVMGLSGEVGELLDAVKKHVIYNKPLDIVNVIEELGDIEFYMEGLRQILCIERAEILATNRNKLLKRYNTGAYSDRQAQARADKMKEEDKQELV